MIANANSILLHTSVLEVAIMLLTVIVLDDCCHFSWIYVDTGTDLSRQQNKPTKESLIDLQKIVIGDRYNNFNLGCVGIKGQGTIGCTIVTWSCKRKQKDELYVTSF